jgi:hypothetical protein
LIAANTSSQACSRSAARTFHASCASLSGTEARVAEPAEGVGAKPLAEA